MGHGLTLTEGLQLSFLTDAVRRQAKATAVDLVGRGAFVNRFSDGLIQPLTCPVILYRLDSTKLYYSTVMASTLSAAQSGLPLLWTITVMLQQGLDS